jgi:predicted kinase
MMGIPGTITELHAWLNTMVTDTDPSRGTLVMLCGMAGSGKTTAATFLEARGFVRLSIDEEIWHRFGRFGIDYPAEIYPSLQQRVASDLWSRLPALLEKAVPIVIDNSFWNRETRDRYKRLAESYARRWILLYLKTSPTVLRERLYHRRERFDANAAFPIHDELLDSYLKSFQEPFREGEIVFE